MRQVASRTRSISCAPRVTGGSTQAESPEWMPASSMCSMMPPRYMLRAVVEGVDVDLDGVVEEPVDQQRVVRAMASVGVAST